MTTDRRLDGDTTARSPGPGASATRDGGLHEWFPEETYRWEKKEFAKAAAAKKGTKQNMGEELLILNY